jgi:hypothetical protein
MLRKVEGKRSKIEKSVTNIHSEMNEEFGCSLSETPKTLGRS